MLVSLAVVGNADAIHPNRVVERKDPETASGNAQVGIFFIKCTNAPYPRVRPWSVTLGSSRRPLDARALHQLRAAHARGGEQQRSWLRQLRSPWQRGGTVDSDSCRLYDAQRDRPRWLLSFRDMVSALPLAVRSLLMYRVSARTVLYFERIGATFEIKCVGVQHDRLLAASMASVPSD